MKVFMMKVGMALIKVIPMGVIRFFIKVTKAPISETDLMTVRNASVEEMQRMIGLMENAKAPSPLNMVEPSVDFEEMKKKFDNETIGRIFKSAPVHIGASADLITEEFKDAKFTNHFLETYGSATITNSMKWNCSLVDDTGDYTDYDFEAVDKIVDMMNAKGMRVRGHTLIWGKFRGKTFPTKVYDDVENAADKKAELKRIIKERIDIAVGHFKGRVHQWDVVNETMPYSDSFEFDGYFYEILGDEYITYSLECARAADPDAELIINEAFGPSGGEKGEKYIQWLKGLVAKGVPLDGVGIQGHITKGKADIDGVVWFAKELGKLGLKLEISEFDMSINAFRECQDDLKSQGQYTYDYFEPLMKLDNLSGITFWGSSDIVSWYDSIFPFDLHAPNKPNPFDEKLQPKPMVLAVAKLVEEKLS